MKYWVTRAYAYLGCFSFMKQRVSTMKKEAICLSHPLSRKRKYQKSNNAAATLSFRSIFYGRKSLSSWTFSSPFLWTVKAHLHVLQKTADDIPWIFKHVPFLHFSLQSVTCFLVLPERIRSRYDMSRVCCWTKGMRGKSSRINISDIVDIFSWEGRMNGLMQITQNAIHLQNMLKIVQQNDCSKLS